MSGVGCNRALEAARALSYLTTPLKGDSGGQRGLVRFSLGCKGAADSMPCHPQSPLGGTAVTVSGRRRWCPDVTPAGALTQVLGRPLASPRVSTSCQPSAVSRAPDRRGGSLWLYGSLSRILLRRYNAAVWTADNRRASSRRCWSSDPKPFQIVTAQNKAGSLRSP